MTLEAVYRDGPTLVTCDVCGRTIEVAARSEHRAVDEAERVGWRFPDETDRAVCADCDTEGAS